MADVQDVRVKIAAAFMLAGLENSQELDIGGDTVTLSILCWEQRADRQSLESVFAKKELEAPNIFFDLCIQKDESEMNYINAKAVIEKALAS